MSGSPERWTAELGLGPSVPRRSAWVGAGRWAPAAWTGRADVGPEGVSHSALPPPTQTSMSGPRDGAPMLHLSDFQGKGHRAEAGRGAVGRGVGEEHDEARAGQSQGSVVRTRARSSVLLESREPISPPGLGFT